MTEREKFEVWYLREWGHTEDDHSTLFERCPDEDDEYYRMGVRLAHEAWQAATASNQEQLAALAAENTALKSALNPKEIPEDAVEAFTETAIMDHDWDDTGSWSWVENDTDVIRAVLAVMASPETPATDAFIAEQQVIGVERAIEVSKNVVSEEFQYTDFESAQNACRKYPESDLVGKVEMIEWLSDFAQQLRDEVKS